MFGVTVELGLSGPVCLAVDNEAAIKIAQNRGVTSQDALNILVTLFITFVT